MPKTILVVEDDRSISDVYSQKLRLEGYEVVQMFNGASMVGLLKQRSIDIDLVLLDLRMPKMHGDEALEKMRKIDKYRHTPVIILTNIGKEEAPKTIWHLGVHEYILKINTTPKLLAERVAAVINSDSEIAR